MVICISLWIRAGNDDEDDDDDDDLLPRLPRPTYFDVDEDGEQIDLQGVTAIKDFDDLRDNYMSQVDTDVLIDDGAGLTISLLNVDLGDLGARDFIF